MNMEESQVKLYGNWASAFVHRVIWALKLKNIEFEYIEEDLSNKSPALLGYNPIHKKVPVVVHGGRPVVESDVILEYIEEAWPDRGPALFPADPHERATARFWIDLNRQQVPTIFAFLLSTDKNREDNAKQVLEMLKLVQARALGDKKFFGGDKIGLVDLSFGWLAHWFEPIQELVGLRAFGPSTLPKLHQWTLDFKQEPVISENLPDSEALFGYFGNMKKSFT